MNPLQLRQPRRVAGVLLAAALLAACNTPAQPATQTPALAAAVPTASAAPATTPLSGAAVAAAALLPTATPAASAVPAGPAATAAPVTPSGPYDPAANPLALVTVAEGFEFPTFLTHAGDGSGRLFVVEKPGRIRTIAADGQLLPTPFLDITDRVGSGANEQGLLGLAFTPDYASSGRFFVNYTNRQGDTVIGRFQVTADANVADPASERQVLLVDQPAANHNGGMITFGPDGMLWIGMGDGGGGGDTYGNGQNPASLLAKMLRIDVNVPDDSQPYTVPADNPWATQGWNGQTMAPEAWAIGLRNPWRFSFDTATGDLWIADVGQNTYEEVNRVAAGSPGGLNFGWPIMEGLHCFAAQNCAADGLVLPVIEYDHAGNCSVTGGYVYRGQALPALQGVYVYADYCSMRIWAATPGANNQWASVLVLQGDNPITSFGTDEVGEVYIVESSGRIARLAAGQ